MVGKLANSAMCFDNDAYESQHCFSLGCMYMYNSSQDLLVQCKSALFALKVFSVFYPVNLALKLFNNTMQLNFAPDCIHCLCFFWQWYSKLNDIIFYSFFFLRNTSSSYPTICQCNVFIPSRRFIISTIAYERLEILLSYHLKIFNCTFITYNTFECFVNGGMKCKKNGPQWTFKKWI